MLWILDGLLQAQPAMPLGLAANVTQPSADGSPGWVRGLVDFAAQGWSYHPVSAAAVAVWIQVGVGIWLPTAARGPWSRLGGLASGSVGAVLSGGRAVSVTGPGAAWRVLPALPALPGRASSAPDGGATLAAAPGGGFEALSARRSQLPV